MSAAGETVALFLGADSLLATGILGLHALVSKIHIERGEPTSTPQTVRATTGTRPVALTSTPLVECKNCDSTNVQRRGHLRTRQGLQQRYSCNECGSWWQHPATDLVPVGRAS